MTYRGCVANVSVIDGDGLLEYGHYLVVRSVGG